MTKKIFDVVWHDKQRDVHIFQIHSPVQLLKLSYLQILNVVQDHGQLNLD